jgi:two-component system nitrate/nitrite response regulator NarL
MLGPVKRHQTIEDIMLATDTAPAVPDTPILEDPARVRVVVADDHPLFRQGIVRALRVAGGFEIVAEAADGATALSLIHRHDPDVAVVDVRMPGMDGIDVIAALARSGSDVPVVLLSAFDDESLVAAGLEAGAAGYITKNADRETICSEIARAARERRSPTAIHGLPDLRGPRLHGWSPRLTSREHRLLQLAHAGWDKPELALLCGVDEPTLRRQLASALAKLGADDLIHGLEIARSQGIVR